MFDSGAGDQPRGEEGPSIDSDSTELFEAVLRWERELELTASRAERRLVDHPERATRLVELERRQHVGLEVLHSILTAGPLTTELRLQLLGAVMPSVRADLFAVWRMPSSTPASARPPCDEGLAGEVALSAELSPSPHEPSGSFRQPPWAFIRSSEAEARELLASLVDRLKQRGEASSRVARIVRAGTFLLEAPIIAEPRLAELQAFLVMTGLRGLEKGARLV